MFGAAGPIEPGIVPASLSVTKWVTGLVSVSPYPCCMRQPSRSPHATSSSADSGAAPEFMYSRLDRSYSSTSGCLASASTIGGTTQARVIR